MFTTLLAIIHPLEAIPVFLGLMQGKDTALVPMAMPIMFGPGAIATIIGMSRTVKKWAEEVESFVAIVLVIIASMGVNFVSRLYSKV